MCDERESPNPIVTLPPEQLLAIQTAPLDSSGGDGCKPFSLGNRPALTGLRTLCIAVVLVFHSNFRVLPGSWVGPGVFFVLSGFLITSMLAVERQRTGGISLRKFYYRRGVRLVPPLLLTVALLGIYAGIVPVANAANRIWADSAAAVLYVSDYRSAFGHEPFLGFMSQCWSLAIEEQFYLIWAALLLVALKFGNRKVAYAMACAGIVAFAANRMRIVLDAHQWNSHVAARAYFAFDVRADALFLGCLLGLIATGGHLENWAPWAKRMLTVLAIVSTAVMIWIASTVGLAARSLPLWWLPISEVASAVIIIYLIIHSNGWGSRALSLSALVLIGNMSYTIYIIHFPVYLAIGPATVGWPFWVTEGVRLAVILSVAAASWYLMERPLMRWRRRALDPASDPIGGKVADAGGPPVGAGGRQNPGSPGPGAQRPVRRATPALE